MRTASEMWSTGRWISHHGNDQAPPVTGYVLDFAVETTVAGRISVSADQQYQLFLDGLLIGRTRESGTPQQWFYETYELNLRPGRHVLAAMVWCWNGEASAVFQMSIKPGFLLVSSEPLDPSLLDTGRAPWRSKVLPGIRFTEHEICLNGWTGVPPSQTLNALDFPWEWLSGKGGEWSLAEGITPEQPVQTHLQDARNLQPSTLPPPFLQRILSGRVRVVSHHLSRTLPGRDEDVPPEEWSSFDNLIQGKSLTLPPKICRKVLVDLGNYYCAYPKMECSQGRGCRIRLTWAESLFDGPEGMEKGQRDELTGKYFRGIWDEFILDGSRHRILDTLTWRAGRFLEITIENASEPVTIEGFALIETRYPLEDTQHYQSDDESLNAIQAPMVRSLQMSAHENFVDCPYYERLLYAGDGRLQALVTYAGWGDDRLARKAIALFASSCEANGLCLSRYPSRQPLYIPSFSLWWVCMVYDFARWRNDRDFVRSVLPEIRSTLEFFLSRAGADGMVPGEPSMWNFIDWVEAWQDHPGGGTPPGANGKHGILNGLLVYTLRRAAAIERYAGDASVAARYESFAARSIQELRKDFWNSEKGLFNDDVAGTHFSEHSQILAILNHGLEDREARDLLPRALAAKGLEKVSLFFTHYLFEAGFLLGQEEIFFERLSSWPDFLRRGFCTTPENFENSRSDCHGWGAHPLYHILANVAGIQPAAMGFERVLISPKLGHLRELDARCCHPAGEILVRHRIKKDALISKIYLPPGVHGDLEYSSEVHPLRPGWQVVETKKLLS